MSTKFCIHPLFYFYMLFFSSLFYHQKLQVWCWQSQTLFCIAVPQNYNCSLVSNSDVQNTSTFLMMKDNYKIPMKNKVTIGSHSWIYIFKKWTGCESFLRIMHAHTHTHYCKKINPACIRTRAKIYAQTDVNRTLVWLGSRMGWGFGSTSGWDGTILCFSFGLRW